MEGDGDLDSKAGVQSLTSTRRINGVATARLLNKGGGGCPRANVGYTRVRDFRKIQHISLRRVKIIYTNTE